MNKIVWALIGLATAAIMIVVIQYGVAPRAVKLIDPSEFQQPPLMGAAIYNRLRAQIDANNVIVMGATPDNLVHQKIALGFLARAAQDGRPFQHIIAEPSTLTELPQADFIEADLNQDMESIIRAVQELPPDRKLFIYTAMVYATHQLPANPMARLENSLRRPLMSISLATLAVKPDEIEKLDPPCKGLSDDAAGTAKLGCMIASRARSVLRRKLDLTKYIMVMTQEGATDYVALVRAP